MSESWLQILRDSFSNLWASFVDFVPRLVGALILLIVGWFIAVTLANLVAKLIRFLRIDKFVEKLEVEKVLEHAGLKIKISSIVAWLIKWFLILTFFIAAADILGWVQIVFFLNKVVLYLPNVVVAVLILLVGILVGNFVNAVVKNAVIAARLVYANFLASVAKWSVYIFSLMAALVQLQVAPSLIQILFTGLVIMLALAGGLAFGLGGKEQAAKFLQKLKKEFSEKRGA